MLADHLYERFGRPDFVLSEHDSNGIAAGSIAVKGGAMLASATTSPDHPCIGATFSPQAGRPISSLRSSSW